MKEKHQNVTSGYTEGKDCFGYPKRNGDRGTYRQHEYGRRTLKECIDQLRIYFETERYKVIAE